MSDCSTAEIRARFSGRTPPNSRVDLDGCDSDRRSFPSVVGGMCEILGATDAKLKRELVIKVVPEESEAA
jgi:hypothetical protein